MKLILNSAGMCVGCNLVGMRSRLFGIQSKPHADAWMILESSTATEIINGRFDFLPVFHLASPWWSRYPIKQRESFILVTSRKVESGSERPYESGGYLRFICCSLKKIAFLVGRRKEIGACSKTEIRVIYYADYHWWLDWCCWGLRRVTH